MTKLIEHLRRRIVAIPARAYAVAFSGLALFGTLFILYLSLNIVLVTDSAGSRQMLFTTAQDPTEIMEVSGIVAGEHDDVFYTEYNGNMASLNIQRAYPVTVEADGASSTIYLTEGTVQQALLQAGITLGEHDYTEPSLNTSLEEGSTVLVHRVEYRDNVVETVIEPNVEYRETSLLYKRKRTTYVEQEGKGGLRQTTTRERVVDGVVESAEIVKVEDVVPAKDTIIMRYGAGAAISSLAAPAGITVENGVPSSYSRLLTGRATAYSASRGRGSSGLGLYEGTVAVDPNVIPYGSLLYIVSTDGKFVYGFAIATDTGSAMVEGHALVDLFYSSYDESVMSSVQSVNVYIL